MKRAWILILFFGMTASGQRLTGSQIHPLTAAETATLARNETRIQVAEAELRRLNLEACEYEVSVEAKYGVKWDQPFFQYDATGMKRLGESDRCEAYRGERRVFYLSTTPNTNPYFTYDYKYLVKP